MRIGLLTTSFPRFENDIAGCFVLGFSRALAALGHRVEVLAPEPDRRIPPPGWEKVSVRWVPYLRPRSLERTFYGAGVPDNLQRSILAWLGLLPFTAQLVRLAREGSGRWDALVSHWALPCALAAASAAGGRRLPHLAVLHSADLHLLRRLPARSLLASRIAGGADKLLFVSPPLEREFLGWLPPPIRERTAARCRVFPMGIDPAPPPPPVACRERLRASLGFDRFTLLSMGRLVGVKGTQVAIRALSGRRDLALVVAGDGPRRGALQELAARVRAPVRFEGTVTGRRKRELFQAADGFVSPSEVLASGRTEGMPTALLEALASGLPAIATRAGAISSYLEDEKTALLVDPGNPGALLAAVDRLVADRELGRELGAAGRALAEGFTWPSLAPRLQELLHTGR